MRHPEGSELFLRHTWRQVFEFLPGALELIFLVKTEGAEGAAIEGQGGGLFCQKIQHVKKPHLMRFK